MRQDHSFTIHHRNIQSMGNELYKVKENLSNKIMNLAFSPRTLNTIYKHKPIFLEIPLIVANMA